jgi:hypothetical protein
MSKLFMFSANQAIKSIRFKKVKKEEQMMDKKGF